MKFIQKADSEINSLVKISVTFCVKIFVTVLCKLTFKVKPYYCQLSTWLMIDQRTIIRVKSATSVIAVACDLDFLNAFDFINSTC